MHSCLCATFGFLPIWLDQMFCIASLIALHIFTIFCCILFQFKVLQSGCWGNIKFERHESQLEKAEGSGLILADPWIRHFRSSRKKHFVSSSTLQEKTAFGSLAVHVSGKMALTSTALAANLERPPAYHSRLCHYDDPVDSSNTGSYNNMPGYFLYVYFLTLASMSYFIFSFVGLCNFILFYLQSQNLLAAIYLLQLKKFFFI